MTKALVLGADGFIGRHIAFALRDAGYEVIASARRVTRLQRMGFATLAADLTDPATHNPDFWAPHLADVGIAINAAGLLTGSQADMAAVHMSAPDAMYRALPSGARALLMSAVGIDTATTDFARFRREAEAAALARNVTVLRAGLVLGDTSYGGSSLARGLAALAFATPLIGGGTQQVNPIHASDLARAIVDLLNAPRPTNVIEIGGPETLALSGMLAAYRRWLGLPPARQINVAPRLARTIGRIGDALRLGPISATAVDQLTEGLVARVSPEIRTPIRPFSRFLNARPAGAQDLWHARLYTLKPLIRLVLAVMWLASGLIGLLLPSAAYLPLLPDAVPAPLLIALAKGGGLVDLAIGVALLRGWRLRAVGLAQLAMVGGYSVGLTLLTPALWLLPLGGLLKNLPVLALIAVHMVLEDER